VARRFGVNALARRLGHAATLRIRAMNDDLKPMSQGLRRTD
jgi:hypothetical protein